MTDPLSIAAGVVGLLSVTAQASKALYKVVHSFQDAPPSAEAILVDVQSTNAALQRLRDYFCDDKPIDPERATMIHVDEIDIIISTCIKTFSELHELIDPVEQCSTWAFRMRWLKLEPKVRDISEKLAQHKASLGLILAILSIEKTNSVDTAIQGLHKKLDAVTYRLMKDRVRRREDASSFYPSSIDEMSTITGNRGSIFGNFYKNSKSVSTTPDRRASVISGFQAELQRSRVYQKINFDDPNSAISISRMESTRLSAFSKISLSKVSNVSVIGLVIDRSEIANGMHYPKSVESTHGFVAADSYSRRTPNQKFLIPRKPCRVSPDLSNVSQPTTKGTSPPLKIPLPETGIYRNLVINTSHFQLSQMHLIKNKDLMALWLEIEIEEQIFLGICERISGIKNLPWTDKDQSLRTIKTDYATLRGDSGPIYEIFRAYAYECSVSFLRAYDLCRRALECGEQLKARRRAFDPSLISLNKNLINLSKKYEEFQLVLRFELGIVARRNHTWQNLIIQNNESKIKKSHYIRELSLWRFHSIPEGRVLFSDVINTSQLIENLGTMAYKLLSSLFVAGKEHAQLWLHTSNHGCNSDESRHACLHWSYPLPKQVAFRIFIHGHRYLRSFYLLDGSLSYDHVVTTNNNVDVSTSPWPQFINPSWAFREQLSFLNENGTILPQILPMVLSNGRPETGAGVLETLHSDTTLLLVPDKDDWTTKDYHSLTEFLGLSTFSFRERLYISMVLVSSILQLGSAPWFHGSWTSDDVFVSQIDSNGIQPTFYEPQNLEIYFKKGFQDMYITQSKFWCIRLGVVLIELALNEDSVKLGLGSNCSVGSNYPVTSPLISRSLTATLTSKVDDVAGEKFGDAVRTCISPTSGMHRLDFWNPTFKKGFSEKIEAPIREVYEDYMFSLNGLKRDSLLEPAPTGTG